MSPTSYLLLHPAMLFPFDWTAKVQLFFENTSLDKEEENIIRIASEIYVERISQRAILIGHKGESIKKVGTQAREEMEKFFGKKIFLEQFIKVEPDWRQKAQKLRMFGYSQD